MRSMVFAATGPTGPSGPSGPSRTASELFASQLLNIHRMLVNKGIPIPAGFTVPATASGPSGPTGPSTIINRAGVGSQGKGQGRARGRGFSPEHFIRKLSKINQRFERKGVPLPSGFTLPPAVTSPSGPTGPSSPPVHINRGRRGKGHGGSED
jgi:hypothetical protein